MYVECRCTFESFDFYEMLGSYWNEKGPFETEESRLPGVTTTVGEVGNLPFACQSF